MLKGNSIVMVLCLPASAPVNLHQLLPQGKLGGHILWNIIHFLFPAQEKKALVWTHTL